MAVPRFLAQLGAVLQNARPMRFAKMQGLANDYVVIRGDEMGSIAHDLSAAARRLCDRRLGVGGDGLLVVSNDGDDGALRMVIHNQDGSRPEMCGNGLRCAVRFAVAMGMARPGEIKVATDAGLRTCRADQSGPVTIDLGAPRRPLTRVMLGKWPATRVDLGNPHAVLICRDAVELEDLDLQTLGPELSRSSAFPDGVNIEWIAVLGADRIRQRTWERGVGETPACGTGAGAVALAARWQGLVGDRVTVELRGGPLTIVIDPATELVWQTGPAELVYRGEIDLEG